MARPAVEVERVGKSFLLPHERRSTIKEHFLHPGRRSTVESSGQLTAFPSLWMKAISSASSGLTGVARARCSSS